MQNEGTDGLTGHGGLSQLLNHTHWGQLYLVQKQVTATLVVETPRCPACLLKAYQSYTTTTHSQSKFRRSLYLPFQGSPRTLIFCQAVIASHQKVILLPSDIL